MAILTLVATGPNEGMAMEDELHAHLGRILDGYFDLRTQALVGRVVTTTTVEQLLDDDELDALFGAFMEVLEERYGRRDPGWRPAAEQMLRAEFDRQIDQQRQLFEQLEGS